MTPPQKQQGVALLIVLMIVALVSILATEMGQRMQLQIQRTSNIKDSNQAYWYAMGAEAFARKSIATLVEQTDGVISLDQPWSQEFTYPLDNGGIQAHLEDAQSCFNLNALVSENTESTQRGVITPEMEAFHGMLLATELEIDSFTADTVRDSIADWLDSDDMMRPYGAEDSEYESREFPYLAANGPMASQSELRQINGVSPAWFKGILPLVCAIPDNNALKLNVNTLRPENAAVLAGMTGMTLRDATSIIATRPMGGWSDVNDFLAEPAIAALNFDDARKAWFSVDTEYFMLHTKTQYNKAMFTMSTLFKVGNGNLVSVVRREFREVE